VSESPSTRGPGAPGEPAPDGRPRHRLSRRALLGGAGVGAVALAAGGVGVAIGSADSDSSSDDDDHVVAFDGEHQAGIATAAQDRLHFAAFDVVSDRREDVARMLQEWTEAARRMTAGRPAGAANDVQLAPPDDTGEAFGLTAARLTVTIGFGPSLFDDRFGLATRRPKALHDLPPLPGDELDPARSVGDLCVQACADDPQVAFHAVRNLARIARGTAVIRWSQLGFGRTSSTSRAQDTPRNLMGFKDGTNNLKAEAPEALAQYVWVGSEAPDWMRGGTYLVARRIRMLIEVWDRSSLADQEQTFGRQKNSGAPFGGHGEFDPVDPAKLPVDSHVRLARPQSNDGIALLRRGYSFTDGLDAELGQLDAGLFFISFQREPNAFARVQAHLARDRLNEYIKHVGSAVFAVPGGTRVGGDGYVGQSLFA
jgi:deferrochelatase/peroxidase EfeB